MASTCLCTCVLLACAVACDGGREAAPDAPAVLSVFAASSLTDAFDELARGFERAHPAIDVQLSFAGSQVLRLQIEQGARADVFASADAAHVRALRDAGHVVRAQALARGGLCVIVPADNPARIERFEQLGAASRIVIAGEQVPLGRYTQTLFERARAQLGPAFTDTVQRRVVSLESNARLVRAKVELGEADAAIVYRSDALDARGVRAIAVPEALDVQARYEIAALAHSRAGDAARDFIAYARSAAGADVLARHGFVPCGAQEGTCSPGG